MSGRGRATRAIPPDAFDFTAHMRRLCADIVARTPELAHIDMDRVAVAFAQARKRTAHGLYASLTPMRFEGGALKCRRNGRVYTVQRLYDPNGRELLYILTFYLPRFMNMPFREKLTTVFHELWHIGPAFDGDLRRHGGRCYAHTHSQKRYDALVERLLTAYLASGPSAGVYEFLQYDFAGLRSRHKAIVGTRIPRPKLIPVHP